jgi:hypothetical protein
MKRRNFIKYSGAAIMLSPLFGCSSDAHYYMRKIKGYLVKKDNRSSQKTGFDLPPGWEKTSVETALNSRCSSDYDDSTSINHWGLADGRATLQEEQLQLLEKIAHFHRFSEKIAGFDRNGNVMSFYIDPKVTGTDREMLTLESGVMMQTVGLACAAMGIAVVFSHLGENGSLLGEQKLGTLAYRLEPMKPSFQKSFWSSIPPVGEHPWKTGNLPDPKRIGNVSVVKALDGVAQGIVGSQAVDNDKIGQLLWAARGRTPHFYMSKAWGLTIPVALGIQNRSEIVVASVTGEPKRYLNWNEGRPTHSLETVTMDNRDLLKQLTKKYPSRDTFLLLTSTTNSLFALLEIGSMLQNILVQAAALDLSIDAAVDVTDIDAKIGDTTLRAVAAVTTHG